jgi:hypothetical protein
LVRKKAGWQKLEVEVGGREIGKTVARKLEQKVGENVGGRENWEARSW